MKVVKKPAIIGYGWVGKATATLFPEAPIHDPFIEAPRAASIQEINNSCDSAIICVPSNWSEEQKRLDTSSTFDLVQQLSVPLVLIRTTLNVGDCDKLTKNGQEVVFWPEYLGETVSHPMNDQRTRAFAILGGTPHGRRLAITLLQLAYNANVRIHQTDHRTAEVVKLTENRAAAWKVHECQELYDVCEASGLDYYELRELIYGTDPRLNLWWSFVYPEKRGFQSKCIPKDVLAWAAWAESCGVDPIATKAILQANQRLIDSN